MFFIGSANRAFPIIRLHASDYLCQINRTTIGEC